jgi:hypothetical protein
MVSYRVADQVKGGSLLDKQDGTVLSSRWVDDWDYKGKSQGGERLTGLILVVRPDPRPGEEVQGDAEIFLKAGDHKKWRVIDGGNDIVAVDEQRDTGFPMSSNVGLFFSSLENCGFPSTRMGVGGAKFVVGMRAHFVRVNVPKIKATDTERESMQVLKIHTMPWDAVPGSGAAVAPASGGGGGSTDVTDAELGDVIKGLIMTSPGGRIDKSALTGRLFSEAYATDALLPKRTAAVTKAMRDPFLSSIPGVAYSGGVLSVG